MLLSHFYSQSCMFSVSWQPLRSVGDGISIQGVREMSRQNNIVRLGEGFYASTPYAKDNCILKHSSNNNDYYNVQINNEFYLPQLPCFVLFELYLYIQTNSIFLS